MGFDSAAALLMREWAVISGAPFSFAIAVAIVTGIIWRVLHWQYRVRLEHKDSAITLKDTEIADYKRKAGATPDEAGLRIAELEKRISHAFHDPRRLTQQQIDKMAPPLGEVTGAITVTRVGSSAESVSVEAQMRALLAQQGWQVTRGAHTMDSENRPNGGLLITSTAPQPTAYEKALISALQSAGIVHEFQRQPADVEPPLLRMVFADTP